ncbi:secernin-2 [Condylostylus longicornis]|uniref:secernin-2 n=1 Tax=Condylostylus longicornis TaxID=2530218 RepID=UPI00244E2A65|nr:secernin-2 [Condylostylus longicornis]
MANIKADCFVILPPYTENNAIVFGRNSLEPKGEVQKISFHDDGDIPIISQHFDSGSESGANAKNVSVGLVWTTNESDDLKSTDIVKNVLQNSSTAEEAVQNIGNLIETKGNSESKYSFVVCDTSSAWLISTGGQLWAAEIIEGFRRIPSNGLAVTTKIDKSSENLGDKLKDLGLWDGNDDLDFAKSFSSIPNEENWPEGLNPTDDGTFNLRNMLDILRSAANDDAGSSSVSILTPSGISCHWYTATPNPSESVYKPFIFSPAPKISPLTIKVDNGDSMTMLQKLHSQRNWEKIGDLLKSLESTCIDEVNQFLSENPEPNQELDELMKDCVEAEVKFYR